MLDYPSITALATYLADNVGPVNSAPLDTAIVSREAAVQNPQVAVAAVSGKLPGGSTWRQLATDASSGTLFSKIQHTPLHYTVTDELIHLFCHSCSSGALGCK